MTEKPYKKAIDIYPIGICKVQKDWKVNGTQKKITVKGEDFETVLIEKPIKILDRMLYHGLNYCAITTKFA